MTMLTDSKAKSGAARVLARVFGYEAFRGDQQAIIEHVIGGGDALVLMPTGGGKSLCYQVPALVRAGVGIVVSPLIALMQDQVDALTELGVRAAFLNSTQDFRVASWRCSRSTRPIACHSGGTTLDPNTWACRCCTNAGPKCRA